MNDKPRALAGRYISTPIRIRVRVLALIFLVMTVWVVVDTVLIGPRAILPVLGCVAGGIVVGVIGSRMFSLSWDEVSSTVVGRFDVLGVVILVAYATFNIFRGDLLDLWFDGDVLGVATLAALAGAMAGQVIGARRGVRAVLEIVKGGGGAQLGGDHEGDGQRNPPADHQS